MALLPGRDNGVLVHLGLELRTTTIDPVYSLGLEALGGIQDYSKKDGG